MSHTLSSCHVLPHRTLLFAIIMCLISSHTHMYHTITITADKVPTLRGVKQPISKEKIKSFVAVMESRIPSHKCPVIYGCALKTVDFCKMKGCGSCDINGGCNVSLDSSSSSSSSEDDSSSSESSEDLPIPDSGCIGACTLPNVDGKEKDIVDSLSKEDLIGIFDKVMDEKRTNPDKEGEDYEYMQTQEPTDDSDDFGYDCGRNWQPSMCAGDKRCQWQGEYCVHLKEAGKRPLTVMVVLQIDAQAPVNGLIGTAILEVLLLSMKVYKKNNIVLIERMNCMKG